MMLRTGVFLAVFLVFSSAAEELTCWNSDGEVDEGGLICQPEAGTSGCCPRGDFCISNGLCAPGPDKPWSYKAPYFANSCTDKNLESYACAALRGCKDLPVTGNGLAVTPCGDNTYCCAYNDGCDCSKGNFTLPALSTITSIPFIAPSTTSGAISLLSATSGVAAQATGSTLTTSMSSTTTTTAPTSAVASPESSSSNGLPRDRVVALAVGICLGIPSAIAGTLSISKYLRRRLEKKRLKQNTESSTS